MSTKLRVRLEEVKRAALFQQSRPGEYTLTGQGATVKLAQVRGGATPNGSLTLVLDADQAKQFNEAEIGAEFDLVIEPAK